MIAINTSAQKDIWRAVETCVTHGVSAEEFIREAAACWQQALADQAKFAAADFAKALR